MMSAKASSRHLRLSPATCNAVASERYRWRVWMPEDTPTEASLVVAGLRFLPLKQGEALCQLMGLVGEDNYDPRVDTEMVLCSSEKNGPFTTPKQAAQYADYLGKKNGWF